MQLHDHSGRLSRLWMDTQKLFSHRSFQGETLMKPAVTGTWVPTAVNMWMGHTTDGSSSGLHHDSSRQLVP
jgi:hypothetical protein